MNSGAGAMARHRRRPEGAGARAAAADAPPLILPPLARWGVSSPHGVARLHPSAAAFVASFVVYLLVSAASTAEAQTVVLPRAETLSPTSVCASVLAYNTVWIFANNGLCNVTYKRRCVCKCAPFWSLFLRAFPSHILVSEAI